MALATVDASGHAQRPHGAAQGCRSGRARRRGFVFYTNFESAKGRELLAAGKAALCFHWKSLRRQVRVRGGVSVAGNAEADAYFARRIAAAGSAPGRLSSPARSKSRFALEKAVAAVRPISDRRDPAAALLVGFRITPLEMEFWHDRPFRLHERVVFRRGASGAWRKERLYP